MLDNRRYISTSLWEICFPPFRNSFFFLLKGSALAGWISHATPVILVITSRCPFYPSNCRGHCLTIILLLHLTIRSVFRFPFFRFSLSYSIQSLWKQFVVAVFLPYVRLVESIEEGKTEEEYRSTIHNVRQVDNEQETKKWENCSWLDKWMMTFPRWMQTAR